MRRVVIVEGARTPFLRSGTQFNNCDLYELLRHSLLGVIGKAGIPKESIQYMVAGTVLQEIKTYNVAREAVLTAGLDPRQVPCHTVTQACISSNQAITNAAMDIVRGEYDIAVAGGVELLSDVPIRYPKKMRKLLVQANFAKTTGQRLKLIPKMLRPSNFKFDVIRGEFTTGLSMGQHCEFINKDFNVTRQEQDEFALRSHTNAANAAKDGLHSDLVPINLPKSGRITQDNGVRVSPLESTGKLKPAFDKNGSVTAANASYLTDGASCTLLMSESKALELGLKPKAVIIDWVYSALDPKGAGLLLGPSMAVAKLLKKNKNSLKDFDVFEFHEAFAGQLLGNIKGMDSIRFCQDNLELSDKLGQLPMDKLNNWGGSVSLGHPFGATGSRLVNFAANRLIHSNGNLALIGSCAAGGLGHAMIVQRYKPPVTEPKSTKTGSK